MLLTRHVLRSSLLKTAENSVAMLKYVENISFLRDGAGNSCFACSGMSDMELKHVLRWVSPVVADDWLKFSLEARAISSIDPD